MTEKILYIDSKRTCIRMLPLLQRLCYEQFQQAIEQLLSCTTASELDFAAIRNGFDQLKQLFQSQILSLSQDGLAPESVSRWQSIQTEVHKQMRLLATDMIMLQAARNPATSAIRLAGICDRLNCLRQFCQVLLSE
ncbi:heterocyst frequency control protein PatD [Limnofasciculus baicalensis]|uniref:Heterocyst frequency control protein PatD n=1 Tax=Limnofasciculus baicalensis BBK-W-15 TaxID=2699891 RepID=A0AAE3KN00_9CYAN|nr:heterocyst frequency control protein PatD [Limnofasciculus baicalensis]MCP2729316.1 heterocyst frequency control protein PatD [Limnofasciculus baicalensis BBK-W-15]